MADDANGVLYCVSGGKGTFGAAPIGSRTAGPATAMQTQAMGGVGIPLAQDRPETDRNGAANLRGPSFANGAPLPFKHNEYSEGVSPALEWTVVPVAQVYALIVTDSDAKPITPFVHWVIWNIPANVTSLPEGFQKGGRLTEPDGVFQRRTSRGSGGYSVRPYSPYCARSGDEAFWRSPRIFMKARHT
jgi:hypothetical protein